MALISVNRLSSSYLSGDFFKISEISKIYVTTELIIIIDCYCKLYTNKVIIKHVVLNVEHNKIVRMIFVSFELYRLTHAE